MLVAGKSAGAAAEVLLREVVQVSAEQASAEQV
jgi:hypothetical protein